MPKKCGIASFSQNLKDGIRRNDGPVKFLNVAAEEPNETYKYRQNIVATLKTNHKASYLAAANTLNDIPADVVLLQHEFGLYGGPISHFTQDGVNQYGRTGAYLLPLLQTIKAPIITTLHTILPRPDDLRRQVLEEICQLSYKVVTMADCTKHILHSQYHVPLDKIAVIPHGVPIVATESKAAARRQLGLEPQAIYMTVTGLIGPNKGIDLIIRALPSILKRHPEVKLLVVGQTHPSLLALEGEKYRKHLIAMAEELKVCHALEFVNKYIPTTNLMRYLRASDIYLTIHGDPSQAASGTLAYAIGSGLAAISTPYLYAKELLADGRGQLVKFEDPASIAAAANRYIEDGELRHSVEHAARAYGKKMAWPMVAREYLKLIKQAIDDSPN